MRLTYRRATEADKPAMLALAAAVDPDDYLPWVIDGYLKERPGGFYVTEDEGGGLLALASITFIRPGQAFLRAMRVHPEAQGKGVGTEFTRFQVDEAERLGARAVRLLTAEDNLAVHRLAGEKLGFTLRGRWSTWWESLPLTLPADDRPTAVRPATVDDAKVADALFRESQVVCSCPGAFADRDELAEMYAFAPDPAARPLDEAIAAGHLLLHDGRGGLGRRPGPGGDPDGLTIVTPATDWDDGPSLSVTYLWGSPAARLDFLRHLAGEVASGRVRGIQLSLPADQSEALESLGVAWHPEDRRPWYGRLYERTFGR
ncbi:MAG: GNAT family N-acetyltransferase [Bacillota bacterium]